jgi:hypothetical protein
MNARQGDTFGGARWLIGAQVQSADGKKLGNVIDLEVDPELGFKVSALELGRHGWFDRLHLLRPLAQGRSKSPIRLVDWSDIDRIENGRLYCKPGAEVRKVSPHDFAEPVHPARTQSGG